MSIAIAVTVILVTSLVVLMVSLLFDRVRRLSIGSLEIEAQQEFDQVVADLLEESANIEKDQPPPRVSGETPGRRPDPQPVARELALMRKYHAQGLAQSRLSFTLSLVFAAIGFAVIVFAIVTTDASEPIDAQSLPFTSLVSAALIEAVSALFFVQSNRAQRVMVEFFDRLRTDRRLEESLALAERMPDPTIKARMMLVLGLGFADRPITDELMRDTMGLSQAGASSADGKPESVSG